MDISSLIGGLGIGSVLTLFLKEYFDNRKTISKRLFEEKREAYLNYLNTVARTQTMSDVEALWARTLAMKRINLCGSDEVSSLLNVVSKLEPGAGLAPFDELIKAMRKDLFPKVK